MRTSIRILSLALFLPVLGLGACAGSEDIFPSVVLDTTESTAVLPNPISIYADTANNQILVANSNVDIFFDTGSLAVLSVDTTDPDAPQLSATQIISAPNFAGEMYADGAGGIYIPYRQESAPDADTDIIRKYTLAAGSVTLAIDATVADNPYGIASDGTSLYVVSDDTLEILDTSLTVLTDIDLTTADDADIDYADSEDVQDVVIDAIGNHAIVSNQNGKMFIVDLATQAIIQTVDGPESTRDMILDGQILYVLDANARLVWVFDMSQLPAPTTTPEDVDDSTFLIATISTGTTPSGIALDTVNQRLYVSNGFDDTISVIDTLTFEEIARISLDDEDLPQTYNRDGGNPQGLTLATFGGRQYLFVAGFDTNDVIMIDTTTLKVVELYPDNALNVEEDEDEDD